MTFLFFFWLWAQENMFSPSFMRKSNPKFWLSRIIIKMYIFYWRIIIKVVYEAEQNVHWGNVHLATAFRRENNSKVWPSRLIINLINEKLKIFEDLLFMNRNHENHDLLIGQLKGNFGQKNGQNYHCAVSSLQSGV